MIVSDLRQVRVFRGTSVSSINNKTNRHDIPVIMSPKRSEELIGNDENSIQGHFYDATIFKMASNKIVKLSMVSDFNEHWYLGVYWSEEFVGNDETWILHPHARILIRGSLGDFCVCIQTQSNLVILIILIILLPHIFVRSISRRCLDKTLWNLVGISYAMWSCAFKGWYFQNGCRCNGNGQNAKKNEKHKTDHSRLLAEQKLIELDRNNIHI